MPVLIASLTASRPPQFLVDYSVSNYQQVPAGWDDIDALVTPYTFDYNTPGFSR